MYNTLIFKNKLKNLLLFILVPRIKNFTSTIYYKKNIKAL